MYGCAYLVGMRKQFVDGKAFYLSDHFAVCALLDLNPMHDARDASRKAVQARRAAVCQDWGLCQCGQHVLREQCLAGASSSAGVFVVALAAPGLRAWQLWLDRGCRRVVCFGFRVLLRPGRIQVFRKLS